MGPRAFLDKLSAMRKKSVHVSEIENIAGGGNAPRILKLGTKQM